MVNKSQKDIEQPYIDDSNATINDSPSYESKEVSDRDIFGFAKAILMVQFRQGMLVITISFYQLGVFGLLPIN